ncbi:MAG: PilT protein [Polaromonas sp.]|nr:PilT protein [Polaromonas sp.]
MKLILDTNTVLSALFKPASRAAAIIQMWREDAFEWVSCSQQLEELTRVLARPKIIARIVGGASTAQAFVQEMHAGCTFFLLEPPYAAVCRDARDDYLMALLTNAKPMHLITGDKDLLVLKEKWPAILTATEFLDRL